MLENAKRKLARNICNLPGWHTRHKIIVIESDDWGSIRMSSKRIFELLKHKGIHVDRCPYCSFDTLASETDLTELYQVLKSVKDKNGNPAVITANTIVANPDFDKIKSDNYLNYYFEHFTKTLKKYKGCEQSFALWEQGIAEKVFVPQFHGREHLNISKWLGELQAGNEVILLGFENDLCCLSGLTSDKLNGEYANAFASSDPIIINTYSKIIMDGTRIFNETFHYDSKSFIAPNYSWGDKIERITSVNGIKYLQGNFAQFNPETRKAKYNYTGKQNKYGQYYLVRNCLFEPSLDQTKDWVSSCLRDIHASFLMNKPAIISSHRLNFVGGIVEANRSRNLKLLSTLLKSIVKNWPDIEFMTSDQLGDILSE